MSDLLLELSIQEKRAPAYLSVSMDPNLPPPYLVSSKSGLIWTSRLEDGAVWSIPQLPGDNIQADIVAAIVEKSFEEKWGNLFHLTEEGCNAAISFLKKSFEEPQEIEVLVNPETGLESIEEEGVTLHFVSWVPLDCAIFLPEDRGFLGNLVFFEDNVCAVCVHDARTSICVAVKV